MPYTSIVRAPVLYATWRGFVPDDLRDVTRLRSRSRCARSSARPPCISRVSPGSGGVFTPDDTAALLDFLRGIVPLCTAIHHVIEGDGFIKSARMASLRTMARQTRRPRAFVVHEGASRRRSPRSRRITAPTSPTWSRVASRSSPAPRARSGVPAKIVEPKKKKT